MICQICGSVVQEVDLDCNWLGSCGFKLLFTLSLSHTHFLLLVSYLNWAFDICRFCNIVITSILRCTCLGLGMGQFLGGNTRKQRILKCHSQNVPFYQLRLSRNGMDLERYGNKHAMIEKPILQHVEAIA